MRHLRSWPMREDKDKDKHKTLHLAARSAPRTGEHPRASGAGERVAKIMARAGLCSRREAETWISQGRVALNGVTLENPAVTIKAGDKITVDGQPLPDPSRTRLFLFHKPRGLVTTANDPEGRPAVFDFLRERWPDVPRVVSAGRLDINSEGLLLLTNDGGLARVLELPATGWVRRYRVRAKGKTTQADLDRLRQGVTIDGIKYAPIEASFDRMQGANCWLTMALREGKNREIKRVLEHLGLCVNRLIRISFGPFQLGDLPEGAIKEVPTRVLRDQLGPSLAKAAGADFSRPLQAKPGAEAAGAPALAQAHAASGGGTAPPGKEGASNGAKERAFQKRRSPPGGFARERGPSKRKPPPRRRKHISALRAGRAAPDETRKRRVHEVMAGRQGRIITVERLSAAGSAGREAGKALVKKPIQTKPLTAHKPLSPKGQARKQQRKPVPKPGARRCPKRSDGQKPPPARGKP
ncbi:MAG TPA: pseudouridine synthase [Methylocella sp.]|nr:pseudouridine synthase [Methylocella sp.]